MISTTSAITSPNLNLPVAPRGVAHDSSPTELHAVRENLAGLCQQMEWLRSWWEQYGDMVSAADRTAAKQVHDHFIEGAALSRGVARAAGIVLDVDYIKTYDWTSELPSLWQGMGCAKGLRYFGGNLGLGDGDVTIHVKDGNNDLDFTLEEALRRIDEFTAHGQIRLLSDLCFHFNMPDQPRGDDLAHQADQ